MYTCVSPLPFSFSHPSISPSFFIPPSQTMLRIWDTFLYEGSKVLFRYAIAIFKYNEESLLSQENSIMIFNRLRAIAQEASDVNKLTHVS